MNDCSQAFPKLSQLTVAGARTGDPLPDVQSANHFAEYRAIWCANTIPQYNPAAWERVVADHGKLLLSYSSATKMREVDPIRRAMREADKLEPWSGRDDRWYLNLADKDVRDTVVRYATSEVVRLGCSGYALDNFGIGTSRLGERGEPYGMAMLELLDDFRDHARRFNLRIFVNHNAWLTGDDRWLNELTDRKDVGLMFEGDRAGYGDLKALKVLKRIVNSGQPVWLHATPTTTDELFYQFSWYCTIKSSGTYFSAELKENRGVKGGVTPHPMELVE